MLNCDDCFNGQLVPMTTKSDAKFQIPKDADSTVLPKGNSPVHLGGSRNGAVTF